MSERKSIKVVSVGTAKVVGSTQATQVKAEDGIVYEVWGTEPLEYMKAGAECQIDVEYSEKEGKDGTVYKHHKVTQIYVNGKPVLAKKAGGYSGRSSGKSPEEIASIEAQVAVKAAVQAYLGLGDRELPVPDAVKIKSLFEKALKWCEAKIDASLKQKPIQSATREPQRPKGAVPPAEIDPLLGNGFANAGQFLSKAQEVFNLNKTQVLENPAVKELFDKGDWNKAYLKLAEIQAGKG